MIYYMNNFLKMFKNDDYIAEIRSFQYLKDTDK